MAALDARNVVVERGGVRVLDELSLEIPPDASMLVQGASGAGKTTLFYVLGLLEPPDSGTVLVSGTDAATLSERRRARLRRDRVGFVFQDFQLVPDLTAWENARLPQEHRSSLLGRFGEGSRDAGASSAWLETVFERLDISSLADRYPATLSGGEKQRVAIARAVANRPAVVLADEPTGQLDPEATDAVVELLRTTRDLADTALVVVSHDPRLAGGFDRRVRLVDGDVTGESAPRD